MDLRTGVCPLCQATAVHVLDGALGQTRLPISAVGKAVITHYVCTHCGYTQDFMESPKDRGKVAEKWPHVTPGKPAP
ncbi:MAG TPA: hypothetical protein VD886_19830 [Herpetosiphonaceae bacterium]|nr:hypothetical protein [Herpetosiphonaceae bacterium]